MERIETSLFWQRYLKMPLVGISRNMSHDVLMSILPLYASAGLQNIEITMNSSGAEEMISNATAEFGTCLNIGAGTVCSMADLERALNAGASFIVTPIVDEEVIQACRQASVPVFAGAYTPTEIYKAWCAGADIVKLFPSTAIDIDYIKDIRGPFPHIKLMPTGGIGLDNCKAFLEAGAAGVGAGSHLFDKTMIQAKDWDALAVLFQRFAIKIAG